VSVKNTFIDDWVASEGGEDAAEPMVLRSMPAQLLKNVVQSCIMEGDGRLELSSLEDCSDQAEKQQSASSSNDCSTAASEVSSACDTPTSSSDEQRDLLCRLPEPPGLEVRNTFIHFECSPSDQRVVQSMPHDMFRKCLMAEVLNGLKQERVAEGPSSASTENLDEPAESSVLAPGAEVVIDGLLKAPAFNGQCGTVQSLDEDTGRYNILLNTPAAGHKWAKVKRENLQTVLGPPPPCFAPTLSLDACL
jgi:hypothetical protein